MSHLQQTTTSAGAGTTHESDTSLPGKRTLSEGLPVQRKAAAPIAAEVTAPTEVAAQDDPFALHLLATPIQRRADGDGAIHDDAAGAVGHGGGGASLPDGVREKMEGAFDADLSAVRVHEGPEAEAMGARAYTQGNDIHFAPGQFAPESGGGLELLGHEMAHVMQQSEGRVAATTQAKAVAVNDDDGLEREADEVGARVARGEPARGGASSGARTAGTAPAGVVQGKFTGTIETTKYQDIHLALQAKYDAVPAVWKVAALDKEPQEYASVDEVAAKLNLKAKGSAAAPPPSSQPATPAKTATPTPTPTAKPTASAAPPNPMLHGPAPASAAKPAAPKKLSADELNRSKGKTMARMEYPTWAAVAPLLASYGVVNEPDRQKVKAVIEKTASDSNTLIRGIPDLIARAGIAKTDKIAADVKAANTAAAPDLAPQLATITVGRGDSRRPHEIRTTGGLFGRDSGIVTVEHARALVTQVLQLSPAEQRSWVSGWKWPTPPAAEANAWVATGTSKEGAQKNADSEYTCQLPLTFNVIPGNLMQVGTDTGAIGTAHVIGVRLDTSAGAGDEVLVLTGIPWKYVTHWNKKAAGQAADETAAAAKPAAK